MKITIYDTTLRDGSQGEGINFSLQDKLLLTRRLDELGIDFIEGGYPLSNPKDFEYFQAVRDVPLNRWMGVVRDNLEQARDAGLITKDVEHRVSEALPNWFAPLKDRGYQKGDRVVYSVTPDALRTVVVSAGGQVLLDMTEHDEGARKVVLSSYFAPKSDTREPLLRSLVSSK